MEFELLGWPDDDVTLELDYREFSYAGKFAMSDTGKAVLTEDDSILAAASFSPDRTDDSRIRIRYVTVRGDHRGEGMGPSLLATLRKAVLDHGYDDVAIAVNNPFAYEAAYRAGFGWTGEETGIAELTLHASESRDAEAYHRGLRQYLERDSVSDPERAFIEERDAAPPPAVIDPPPDWLPDTG